MNIFEEALRLAAKTVLVTGEVAGDEAAKRFSACLECDKRNAAQNKCEVCGCFLDVKTKAKSNWNARRLRNEITHCPLGKWEDLNTANMYRQMDGKEFLNKQ